MSSKNRKAGTSPPMNRDWTAKQQYRQAAVARSSMLAGKLPQFCCQAQDSRQGWARPIGPRSIAARAATKPISIVFALRVTIVRASNQNKASNRQDKKASQASKRPRSSGVCSPASPHREARPTRLAGPGQRVGPRHAPRAKRPGCAWLRSRASARLWPGPVCLVRGPHDGAMPGNRHLTRTGPVRNTAQDAVFSQQASTRGLLQGSDEKEGQSTVITGC